jgi:hypothetical protein
MKIEVIKVTAPAEINNYQIIFIPQNKSKMISQIAEIPSMKNFLFVSDKSNSCLVGTDINFALNSEEISFETSKSNIEKYGLKVSNNLLKLAIP